VSHHRPFLVLWSLGGSARVAAFVLHLAMRSRSMHLGYELGRTRAEQARLREVKRVLELEVASYHTPQRVEVVARTLLSMAPPPPERIISMPSPRDGSGAVRPEAVTNGNGSDRGARGGPVAARNGAGPGRGGAAVPIIARPMATELLTPHITPPRSAQTADPDQPEPPAGAQVQPPGAAAAPAQQQETPPR
jgi:cell division protein FtsL